MFCIQMKWLSYNRRGFASSTKKLALWHLVALDKFHIMFLQETLGSRFNIVKSPKDMFKGRAFYVIYARGRSEGLELGVNRKSVRLMNI